MNFLEKLDRAAAKNKSFLCVGLDPSLEKLPEKFLLEDDPIFSFNKEIISALSEFVCAFKPNMAFYEAHGPKGIESLIKTIKYIPDDIPVILDAKRADVGHSSSAYAEAAYEIFRADASTLNPYLGYDSLEPFLKYKDKMNFILCLTSNEGSSDFQADGLYLKVAKKAVEWNKDNNCGLVVGATRPEEISKVRKAAGDMPFLIPGVGRQGGDLEKAVKFGVNKAGKGIIVNASRSIIYAPDPRQEARKLKDQINSYL